MVLERQSMVQTKSIYLKYFIIIEMKDLIIIFQFFTQEFRNNPTKITKEL